MAKEQPTTETTESIQEQPTTETTHEQPQTGGSYMRNADGSLTKIEEDGEE